MSTPLRIDPGLPPLTWGQVQEAFDRINQNFTVVYASIEGGGITPVDFDNLSTNVGPSTDSIYDLGSSANKWRDLFIDRDLHIGDAVITSSGSAVDLPTGSTIGGTLLDNEYFREIAVTGQSNIVANVGGDSILTINPNTGISITTNPATDTMTITNSGIISASAGTGIGVSGTNPLQITNTGIISASAGTGIGVSGTNPLQITNTGVTRLEAGNGMIVDVNTGTVTITNGSPASTLRCFEYINLGPGGIIRADNNFDTVNITGDNTIQINKVGSAASNNIEFTFNNRVDIIGSIFADDSSMLVDGTNGRIVGPVFANVTGNVNGNLTGNVNGNLTGNVNGNLTGFHTGDVKGSVFADDSSILVDAVDGVLRGTLIGNLTGNVTGNLSGNVNGNFTGNVFTNAIDSADSSQIFITPLARFESDVVVENDLTVNNLLLVRGSKIILLNDFKNLVAASTDFADFKARIAALS